MILVSTVDVPSFWLAQEHQNEVINGHCSFVQASKILLAHYDAEAQEAI